MLLPIKSCSYHSSRQCRVYDNLYMFITGCIFLFGNSALVECLADINADCPCIDTTKLFRPISNCKTASRELGVYLHGTTCYPLDYGGSECKAHDVGIDPSCDPTTSDSLPSYCSDPWCYVDVEKCKEVDVGVFISSIDQYPSLERKLFFSYSACNASDVEWLNYETTMNLKGETLLVTVPQIFYPLHYKVTADGEIADNSSPEYYDDAIPWKGYLIDYLNSIVEISTIGGVNFTARSLHGDAVFPQSPHSATVVDIQNGLVDMGLSNYWVTTSRLATTTFTLPFAQQRYKLWIPRPRVGNVSSILFDAGKVLMPFHVNLWLLLIFLVVFVGNVHVLLTSTRGEKSHLYRDLHSPKWRHSSLPKKIFMVSKIIFESVVVFANAMFGYADDTGSANTISKKLLMFGFAFLTLIAVAAYTANLAAFLTLSGTNSMVASMADAVKEKIIICAFEGLQEDLLSTWPRAVFLYSNTFDGLFSNYENGNCDALAFSESDIQMIPSLKRWICQNDLISTGDLILEVDIALPIREKYAPGVSYWISVAEQQRETSYQNFEEAEFHNEKMCDLQKLTMKELDELQAMAPKDFAFPVIVCVCSAVTAIIVHFVSLWKNDDDHHKHDTDGDNSSGNEFPKNELSPRVPEIVHEEQSQQKKISELMVKHKRVYESIQNILADFEAKHKQV